MKERYFSVDIETSGPIIAAHSLLSIGACLCDDLGRTFAREIKPISNDADDDAMAVVGKSLAHFQRDGKSPAETLSSFRTWVLENANDERPVFVGFNASYDWGFVNWYFLTYVGENPFGLSPLDIKAYYAGFAGSTWDETRSSRIPQRFKGTTEHTHDPLEDAIEQAQMFNRIRAAAEARR